MQKKCLISILLITIVIFLCSITFAESEIKNDIMETGNATGQLLKDTKNTVVDTTRNITDNAKNMVNNTTGNIDSAVSTGVSNTSSYDATRTSTGGYTTSTSNFLGFSSATWIWLVLATVTVIIIALVLYYSSQYQHKNYDNQ